MGIYLNPGNSGFKKIRNGTYVDKTGLIDFINRTIDTADNLTCFSRPRRFGKTFAAKMLCAYYDKSCDSRMLFDDLEIIKYDSFPRYLNKFDVIYLDITWFISTCNDMKSVVTDLQLSVIRELKKEFPGTFDDGVSSLSRTLADIAARTGDKFFIIIDEWDALFREASHDEDLQKEYIQFLRGMFKGGSGTDLSIAGAYMTGILPIKKYGTESALTDFKEYTMDNPGKLARYIGFTKSEVKALCEEYHMDFETMHTWYDGYSFNREKHVYSPNSVMSAIRNEEFDNYWTRSETYESLKNYISMNLDGLKDAVVSMLGGQHEKIDILSFQNDLTSLKNKNNVLALLVHLGYLAYDQTEREVYIPNLEVADSFRLAVEDAGWEEIGAALVNSDKLLTATIHGDASAVEDALEHVHQETTSVLKYNDENSLACAVTIAYFTATRFYDIVREMPAGKGFADLVFIPHKDTDKPAMIIELKYNGSADSAIRQIKEKRYDGSLNDYRGNILLVGISYNKNATGKGSKKHSCLIERVTA